MKRPVSAQVHRSLWQLPLALGAYNAGPARVNETGAVRRSRKPWMPADFLGAARPETAEIERKSGPHIPISAYVQPLLRYAEQLLTAAACAPGQSAQPHAICITGEGGIRVLTAAVGWSLPALAADQGAEAVFVVERRRDAVRVEAWSRRENFVLVRKTQFTAAVGVMTTQSWTD